MTIWYCYEKATGRYAGSGTPYIDNETHGSTATPLNFSLEPSEHPAYVWDDETESWVQATPQEPS